MKLTTLWIGLILATLISTNTVYSQNYALDWSIRLSAVVDQPSMSITLNWEPNQASGAEYRIYRRVMGSSAWGSQIGTVPSSNNTYTDFGISVDVSYEYKVEKATGTSLYAWGYMNSAIKLELPANREDILVLVDSTFVTSLSSEIQQLVEDLRHDSWRPTVIYIDRNASAAYVKSVIVNHYNTVPDLRALYILGHVPVPYSGNLYPDAHPDHEGAWPADAYYADMDGTWTDNSVNNTVANDPRNDNIPGDGKFDQSVIPSSLELEVGRVDFHDLSNFTDTEEDLLRNYLNKAHDFKVADYVPRERGLVDQGNFTGFQEGFAQNGFRNFTAFFGDTNVHEVDYFTTLADSSYLWAYGCGGGTYTSANGLDGGSAVTSAEFAAGDPQSTFTMIFGSYFGDWDRDDNLMRSSLASGKTLSVSWAGRPNWHYHGMAMGNHIGASAKMSMTPGSDYWSLGIGLVTVDGVHVSLLGDPSLRMYYIAPPTNLTLYNAAQTELSWTASTDPDVEGYNLYVLEPGQTDWQLVNSSIITGTTYGYTPATTTGTYTYMVKAVKLKENASGSFYNESLGTTADNAVELSIAEEPSVNVIIYPNPSKGDFRVVSSAAMESVVVLNLAGQIVHRSNPLSHALDISLDLAPGVYMVQTVTKTGDLSREQIVIK